MAETSLASVLVAPKQFEVREFDLPPVSPDAGLLKVEACGVCGSDVHGWQRLAPGARILGHENVGIVAQIGVEASRRWNVKEGDRVALEEYVPCGACKWCRSDDFRFCEQTDFSGSGPRLWYGSTPLDVWPALWGGYSQYLYMHPNAVVHHMPSGIRAEHAAAFLPFSNGVEWAYRYGEVGLGKSILIQGPGQQGLACVIASREASFFAKNRADLRAINPAWLKVFPDDDDRPTYKFMTADLPGDQLFQLEFFAVAGQRRRLLHIPNVAHTNPIPMGVRIGNYVFSSRVLPYDPDTGQAPEGIERQAACLFGNVRSLLQAAEAQPEHISQGRLFFSDAAYLPLAESLWTDLIKNSKQDPPLHLTPYNLAPSLLVMLEFVAIR